MDKPHFQAVESVQSAAEFLTFQPTAPLELAGMHRQAMYVYVLDYKKRPVPVGDRSFETYSEGFVLSQSQSSSDEARRRTQDTSYGRDPRDGDVAGHPARFYELGPEVPEDDVDGRSPAVIVWHDGQRFFLVASTEHPVARLKEAADALY